LWKIKNLSTEERKDLFADVLIENGLWEHSKDSLINELIRSKL
jgi:hypothetical protein